MQNSKAFRETDRYAQMGIAALLPGAQWMLDQMQRTVDELRERLTTLQNGSAKKRGRPLGATAAHGGGGWSADPEERRREMLRRMAKRLKNAKVKTKAKAKPTHPRDVDHPDHAKYKAKLKRIARKRWAGMSKSQQIERLNRMKAGRGLKAVA